MTEQERIDAKTLAIEVRAGEWCCYQAQLRRSTASPHRPPPQRLLLTCRCPPSWSAAGNPA